MVPVFSQPSIFLLCLPPFVSGKLYRVFHMFKLFLRFPFVCLRKFTAPGTDRRLRLFSLQQQLLLFFLKPLFVCSHLLLNMPELFLGFPCLLILLQVIVRTLHLLIQLFVSLAGFFYPALYYRFFLPGFLRKQFVKFLPENQKKCLVTGGCLLIALCTLIADFFCVVPKLFCLLHFRLCRKFFRQKRWRRMFESPAEIGRAHV